MSAANIQAYLIKANLYIVWVSDLHISCDVWVPTSAFWINFLGKSLILDFPKM